VYASKAPTAVSWYEAKPAESLELIGDSGVTCAEPIIDVGAGASLLVDELLDAGFRDLTVLDVSSTALAKLRERLGTRAELVTFLESEVTTFRPARQYALWHDRAVFHFLVGADERRTYADALRAALRPNGRAVIATFGPSGPQRCSGLPTARYDAHGLSAEFGGALELMHSRLVLHRTPWHAEQQFLYCLFRKA
jgi:hypothetical protein